MVTLLIYIRQVRALILRQEYLDYEVFLVFLSSSRQIMALYIKLQDDRFLQLPTVRCSTRICLKRHRKTTKNLIQSFGVQAKIQIGHLQNTSLKRYSLSQLVRSHLSFIWTPFLLDLAKTGIYQRLLIIFLSTKDHEVTFSGSRVVRSRKLNRKRGQR
jgi:hypothetical protein